MSAVKVIVIAGTVLGVGAVGYVVYQKMKGASDAKVVLNTAAAVKAASPYEGMLIRIKRDRVYYVVNGILRYVKVLPLVNGKDWGDVVEWGDANGLTIGPDLNLSTLKGVSELQSNLLN